jgi:hypothetical protein
MLLALIALIVIGAVTLLGQNIKTTFDTIAGALPIGGGGGGSCGLTAGIPGSAGSLGGPGSRPTS